MSTSQQTLDGIARPGHLAKTPARRRGSKLTADGDREWWCVECGRRVTEARERDVEYGHAASCEHSIAGGGF